LPVNPVDTTRAGGLVSTTIASVHQTGPAGKGLIAMVSCFQFIRSVSRSGRGSNLLPPDAVALDRMSSGTRFPTGSVQGQLLWLLALLMTMAPALAADSQLAAEGTASTVANETAEPEPPADSATAATTSKKSSVTATKSLGKPPEPPAAASPPKPAKKPVLVPGTGALVKGGTDSFEDEKWTWFYNHPKSSEEQDKRMRTPLGKSNNGLWFEGPKRGTPDVVKRIALPAPGLEGSEHGLLIATLRAGVPGGASYGLMQDDLIFNLSRSTGRGMSVADSPSVVTRVYLPPFSQWERRNGPSFGYRTGCYTHAIITGEDHPDRGEFGLEEYWPGMFICLQAGDGKTKEDTAYIRVRSGHRGQELRGPTITGDQLGWWTLGLSFSSDGMVHFFASPGVDDLTMDDHITSQFPYGYRTEWVKTYFFNVCTRDDGRTWSTPWVIDDPKAYFVPRSQVATPGKRPARR
jgi:hypothetical protein